MVELIRLVGFDELEVDCLRDGLERAIAERETEMKRIGKRTSGTVTSATLDVWRRLLEGLK